MDEQQLNPAAHASAPSRRRLLGGLASLAAGAALLKVEQVAAKPTSARERARARARARAKAKQGKALGTVKVAICHLDEESGLYGYQQVPQPALKGHRQHGDVVEGVTSAQDCDALNPLPEPVVELEV